MKFHLYVFKRAHKREKKKSTQTHMYIQAYVLSNHRAVFYFHMFSFFLQTIGNKGRTYQSVYRR